MTKLSFLDLVPILEGGTISAALANARDIAAHCEVLGFERYWVAGHHGMPGTRDPACRGRRDHAAQASPPPDARAMRHARCAVSGPDRSRAGPRAGLRWACC